MWIRANFVLCVEQKRKKMHDICIIIRCATRKSSVIYNVGGRKKYKMRRISQNCRNLQRGIDKWRHEVYNTYNTEKRRRRKSPCVTPYLQLHTFTTFTFILPNEVKVLFAAKQAEPHGNKLSSGHIPPPLQ